MTVRQPPVDPRDFGKLVRDTRAAIRTALGLPKPEPGTDPPVPGDGLVHVFARLAEIVSERINRVPEKNLLAFLSLIGLEQQAPQPARVPLTFQLAQGATQARVPAGTTAAATPLEGEDAPPTYETERELVVTPAVPVAMFARDPAFDRFRDASATIAGTSEPVPVFEGDVPIGHELYIGDPLLGLPQSKDVVLRIEPAEPFSRRWFAALSWSTFDGEAWHRIAPTVLTQTERATGLTQAAGLSFPPLAAVAPSTVAGVTQPWLRARLMTSLPREALPAGLAPVPAVLHQDGLAPDAAVAGSMQLLAGGPLAPFGVDVPETMFYLACERAFSKPGARVRIAVEVDDASPATPNADLRLRWEAGTQELGTTSPKTTDKPQGDFGFVDRTRAFSTDGEIAFTAPADWPVSENAGLAAHWLRVTVVEPGGFGAAPVYHAPLLTRVAISYDWTVPQVTSLMRDVTIVRTDLAPDAILFDDTLLDASKDFLPFGPQPSFNDAFYVACDEAFSLPDTTVTLRIVPTDAVQGSADVKVTWEVYHAATRTWVPAEVLADTTDELTFKSWKRDKTNAQVRIRMPDEPGAVELAGQPRYCVRVRLTSGDYGGPASFQTVTEKRGATDEEGVIVTVTTIEATWDPPSIKALAIDYSCQTGGPPPDAVVTVNDFEAVAAKLPSQKLAPFQPFTVTHDERPTFYVGMNGDFANNPTMLFLDVAPATYAADARRAAPAEPPAVAWEYRTEDGWEALVVRPAISCPSGGLWRCC